MLGDELRTHTNVKSNAAEHLLQTEVELGDDWLQHQRGYTEIILMSPRSVIESRHWDQFASETAQS